MVGFGNVTVERDGDALVVGNLSDEVSVRVPRPEVSWLSIALRRAADDPVAGGGHLWTVHGEDDATVTVRSTGEGVRVRRNADNGGRADFLLRDDALALSDEVGRIGLQMAQDGLYEQLQRQWARVPGFAAEAAEYERENDGKPEQLRIDFGGWSG